MSTQVQLDAIVDRPGLVVDQRDDVGIVDVLFPVGEVLEALEGLLKGIVAHTISGWAVTPTYHDKTDDIAHLDLPFMTQAIQSLIVPVEYLVNSDFKPEWKPGGKPE